jgi:ADP-ribose pyrophosphatase YjhB (NUDIX family)
VGIAAHIARLRAVVGHELLLLPSVSVLPVDGAGRVLLVRHAGHDDGWGVLGGAVDVGESPAAAAVREAREEISAGVQLVRLVDVLGGPDFEVSYPNGDRTAYVTAVYEARIITGSPAPGGGELSELAWFTPGQLPGLQLSRFARALLHATGRLCFTTHPRRAARRRLDDLHRTRGMRRRRVPDFGGVGACNLT